MDRDEATLLRHPVSPPNFSDNYESLENQAQGRDPHSFRKLPQYTAALIATLSALAAGTCLGWTSPILAQLEAGKFHNIPVNKSQEGWIGSLITVGAMVSCVPAGIVCNLIGRKRTLLLLGVPFAIGWGLIFGAHSVTMLYLGRLMLGVACGACCVAAPLYTSEVAHRSVRGALGSYFQLMVTVGVFCAYLAGKFLSATGLSVFCACVPLLFVVLFATQPETPAYYLQRGLHDEALASLRRLRGSGYDAEGELAEIEGAIKESLEVSVSIVDTVKRKSVRRAAFIAFSLMFFQQFSGINAVILYTSDIFSASGEKLNANTASIIVGAVQALATFLSSLLIDRLGRRFLLILSAAVMALSSCLLAVFFTLKDRAELDAATLSRLGWLPVVCLCVFVAVFSAGFGPIPWLISTEVFAPEVRSVASAAAGSFNWFLAFLVTKFYLEVGDAVGQDTTFYAFASVSAVGAVFTHLAVPETKGKSGPEIQAELEGR